MQGQLSHFVKSLPKVWLKSSLVVFLVSLIFFLVYIQIPGTKNFDEFHYVPAAKQLLSLEKNQNWEHPPLGKWIIASGIAIFGDTPFGWRFASAFFGALTAVALFVWGGILFRSLHAAWLVVGFSWVNHLLYVQSRIAMLDSSLIFFLIAFVAIFHSFWTEHRFPKIRLILMGVCLGCASAIKWYGIAIWACFLGLILLLKLFSYWKVRFEKAESEDFYRPDLFSEIKLSTLFFFLFLLPLTLYFSTFLPYLLVPEEGYRFIDLLSTVQKKMFEGQLNVTNPHPYMSRWYQWPLLFRPIWYLFDKINVGEVRGILLIGNPWLMWGGFVSMCFLLIHFLKIKSRLDFQIVSTYLIFLGVWVLIPRKVAFYYYYYPAGIALTPAVIRVFQLISQHLDPQTPYFFSFDWKNKFTWYRFIPMWCFFLICLFTFIFFFPILSGMPIPEGAYLKYTWFRSWI